MKLILSFFFLCSVLFSDSLDSYLNKHKDQLPIIYMPNIYLTDIKIEKPFLNFIFNIDKSEFFKDLSIKSKIKIDKFDNRIKSEFLKALKYATLPQTCNQVDLSKIIKDGYQIKYTFYFNKNEFMDYFFINKTDCNFKD